MLLSVVAGRFSTGVGTGSWRDSTLGGVIAGAVCAFLGIAVSLLLGDVAPIILVIGTLSSAVGGVIGGAIGKLLK